MTCNLSEDVIERVIAFHGHWCPGLAIGIRVAELALSEVGKAGDEDIVAVVETDMCGVDAVQYLTGCTFGKGNLIHHDYGKNAFSFFRRDDGKSLRIVARPGLFGEAGQTLRDMHRKMAAGRLTDSEQTRWEKARKAVAQRVMTADLGELFDVKAVREPMPKRARILDSLVCKRCGESMMQTRARQHRDQTLCIPCFEKKEN